MGRLPKCFCNRISAFASGCSASGTPSVGLCLAAAVHFPGLRLQHWDVAFCEGGPVLMELNTEADLGVPQYLGRTPFIDRTIREML